MNPRVFTSGELGELLSLVQIQKLDTLNNCFKSVGQATASGGGFIDTLVDNIRLAFPENHRVFEGSECGQVQQVLVRIPVGAGNKNGDCFIFYQFFRSIMTYKLLPAAELQILKWKVNQRLLVV